MLNLEWFRTFKVIYEVGTLSAAAQALYISQPGVSLHLNSLESYTGCRLFEREARRVIPTERGIFLYNYIIESMVKLEEIEQAFHRNSKVDKPTLSIGMCYTTFMHTIEKSVGTLPFNLITRFGECSEMLEYLDSGAIDFILTSEIETNSNLIFTPFLKERIVLACGSQTDNSQLNALIAANDREQLSSWLKQQTWFATCADMQYLRNFWQTNFRSLPDFKPSFILPYFDSIIRCLRDREGFAVIPDFLCKKDIDEGSIKLAWEGSPYLEKMLYFGKRKKTIYSKEIQYFEDILAKSWFR